MDIDKIQEALREKRVDGWLLCDFHNRDHLAYRVLGLDFAKGTSRRWFYFIPAKGDPVRLVSAVEPARLDSLPGEKRAYRAWGDLHAALLVLKKNHSELSSSRTYRTIEVTGLPACVRVTSRSLYVKMKHRLVGSGGTSLPSSHPYLSARLFPTMAPRRSSSHACLSPGVSTISGTSAPNRSIEAAAISARRRWKVPIAVWIFALGALGWCLMGLFTWRWAIERPSLTAKLSAIVSEAPAWRVSSTISGTAVNSFGVWFPSCH